MSDFLARKAQVNRAEKAEQWREIQAKAPELAAFLQALTATTGKLKSVRVRFEDGTVIEVKN
jgi:hypothetical protein